MRAAVRYLYFCLPYRNSRSQMLDRPADALEAYKRAAELSCDGKPNAEVAARLKALGSGKPKAPGAATPSTVSTSSKSAFVFKPLAAKDEAEQASTWLDAGRAGEALGAKLREVFGNDSDVVASFQSASETQQAGGHTDAVTFTVSVAQAVAHRKGASDAEWQLLAPDGLLFRAMDRKHWAAAARALETFRREHTPGETMPLPADPAALVLAAGCAPETVKVRRAAFEACNAAFLAATRPQQAATQGGGGAFDQAVVAGLMQAGLADACLDAVSPAVAPVVREAAAGTFHNLVHHARRQAQSRVSGPDEAATVAIHEHLAQLLDRPGNPLDDESADVEDADAAEWDGAAAHAFWAPVASLLASDGVRHLVTPLALQLLRCNALDMAQRVHQQGVGKKGGVESGESMMGMVTGVATVLTLLERVRTHGAADALRPLVQRAGVAQFRRDVASRVQAYLHMASALADLKLGGAGRGE